jgi:hypothetical protein
VSCRHSANSLSFEPIRTNQSREISHAPPAFGRRTRVVILHPVIAKEWTDEECGGRERCADCNYASRACVIRQHRSHGRGEHHIVTGRYINRVDAAPNRQASGRNRIEPSGELSGRTPPNRHATEPTRSRIESPSELSGRTPDKPPNRIVRRAVRQDATEPTHRRTDTLPNRHAAESNRQASCQVGRHRTNTPPNQHAAESNRQASCQAGRWTHRRIESSGELSGRVPPNRHTAEPIRS